MINLRLFLFPIFCLLLCSLSLSARFKNKCIVRNQEDFDKIVSKINAGETCDILLLQGRYVLNECIESKAPLSIEGNDASVACCLPQYLAINADSVTDDFYIYRIKSSINHFSLFLDSQDNIIPISESIAEGRDVNISHNPILDDKKHNAGTKMQIPIADGIKHLQNMTFERAYGYLDCGWSRVNFTVEASDADYFYCTALESTNVPSFNYDINVYKKDLRYVIFNAEKREEKIFYDSKYLYVPKSMTDIRCLNCSVYTTEEYSIKTKSQLNLSGVNFVNFNGIYIQSGESDLCEISKCSFKNTLGYTLYINKTNGPRVRPVVINNCIFSDCSLLTRNILYLSSLDQRGVSCIYLTSSNICRYSSDKLMYKNCNASIYVDGDVTLQSNKIYNTCRSHLFLNRGNIVVRNNSIYNTNIFNSYPLRNLSNDFGLIYCNHIFRKSNEAILNKKSSILLESNLLYGSYAFSGDARGIFIDDGRGDVYCKGNMIFDTQSYSIDSRVVPGFVGTSSIRNILENNYVTNTYRLQAGEDVPNDCKPIINKNYILSSLKMDTLKVFVQKDDIEIPIITNLKIIDNKLRIKRQDYKLLKDVFELSHLKKSIDIIKE